LWGSADPAIELSLARRSVELCDRGALRILDGASHFIQHEAADVVNEALASFLDGVREGRSAVRPARAPS
jgi:pimeloyl-ACP methyl ester carboxylesterase